MQGEATAGWQSRPSISFNTTVNPEVNTERNITHQRRGVYMGDFLTQDEVKIFRWKFFSF